MALAATSCLIGPVLVALSQRIPNRVEQPLSDVDPSWYAEPVPISGGAYLSINGIDAVHRITLATPDVGQLASHREIGLLVATHGTYPQFERAQLVFAGTPCVYRTVRGSPFPNNAVLTFVRGDRCVPLSGTPTGKVELTVRLHNVAKLALWTFVPPPTVSTSPHALFVGQLPTPGVPSYLVRGRLADSFQAGGIPRIGLLAYVWQLATGGLWIWFAVALSALLLFVGNLGFWSARSPLQRLSDEALKRGGAAFCLAAGLGILYTVITPPFQAPDEPSHLVAFGAWAGRPDLGAEAAEWARVGHVQRIQFHVEEHFRVSDVGHPGEMWSAKPVPDADIRGKGVQFIWHALPMSIRQLPPPRLLLALRATNALIFSIAVGVVVAAAVRLSGLGLPHLLALPLFLVPTLPFFGMHLSNHAPLLAAYALTALGVTLMVLDCERSDAAGVIIGAGWASAFMISRSAMPLASFIGVLLAARIVVGASHGGPKATLVFWIGVTCPVALALLGAERPYLDSVTRITERVLPATVQRALETGWSHPSLLLLAAVIAAAAEIGLAWLRGRFAPVVRTAVRTGVGVGTAVAAATVAAVMFGSLFVRYPVLERTDPLDRPPAAAYARETVIAGLSIVRITQPDYLTSVTFWGAFGWLETLTHPRVISLLAGATGLGLVTLLLRLAWKRDARRALYVAAAVVGYCVSLAAYAASMAPQLYMDLVGRYLVGLYLAMLLICWSPVTFVTPWKQPRLSAWICGCAAFASAVIHAYSLRLILLRYF